MSWVNSVLRQFLPHGSTAQDAPAHIASKKVNSGSNRWKRWVLRPWNPGGDFLSLSWAHRAAVLTAKREKESEDVFVLHRHRHHPPFENTPILGCLDSRHLRWPGL